MTFSLIRGNKIYKFLLLQLLTYDTKKKFDKNRRIKKRGIFIEGPLIT